MSGEVFTALPSSPLATRPHLAVTKQSSSDIGNEEWETASESSDVLEVTNRISKNGLGQEAGPPVADAPINSRVRRGEVTRMNASRRHLIDGEMGVGGGGRMSGDQSRRSRHGVGRGRGVLRLSTSEVGSTAKLPSGSQRDKSGSKSAAVDVNRFVLVP